jgi:hypothetical protein
MLGRLERAFERIVDGGIASAFRLRVQPAEIGRQLERAMLHGRVTSVGTTIAPNAFEVRLHPDDAAAFADWNEALSREMETWLAELAYARGITNIGSISVRFVADPSMRRRSVHASGRFEAGRPRPQDRRVDSPDFPCALRLVPTRAGLPSAALHTASLTVGRAEDNDLVLADSEVSRHHARFERDGAGWLVFDLESTNGTWVNGENIQKSAIAEGDDLAFGRVRFTILAE